MPSMQTSVLVLSYGKLESQEKHCREMQTVVNAIKDTFAWVAFPIGRF